MERFFFSGKVKKTGKSDVESAKKFFKMLDKDEDGKISRVSLLSEEEVKKKKKLAQKNLESVSKELRSRVQLLKRLFAVV